MSTEAPWRAPAFLWSPLSELVVHSAPDNALIRNLPCNVPGHMVVYMQSRPAVILHCVLQRVLLLFDPAG